MNIIGARDNWRSNENELQARVVLYPFDPESSLPVQWGTLCLAIRFEIKIKL